MTDHNLRSLSLAAQAEDLRAIAKAATPGPWESRTEVGHPGVIAVASPRAFDWICSMQLANSPRYAADARHIAAWSPDVALEKLDRIAELEAALVEACELFYVTPEQRAAGVDPEMRLAALRAKAARRG